MESLFVAFNSLLHFCSIFQGVVAIRPLVAKGSQVCFISQVVKYWPGTEKAVTNRHGV
jgi:hypothetical protein